MPLRHCLLQIFLCDWDEWEIKMKNLSSHFSMTSLCICRRLVAALYLIIQWCLKLIGNHKDIKENEICEKNEDATWKMNNFASNYVKKPRQMDQIDLLFIFWYYVNTFFYTMTFIFISILKTAFLFLEPTKISAIKWRIYHIIKCYWCGSTL